MYSLMPLQPNFHLRPALVEPQNDVTILKHKTHWTAKGLRGSQRQRPGRSKDQPTDTMFMGQYFFCVQGLNNVRAKT